MFGDAPPAPGSLFPDGAYTLQPITPIPEPQMHAVLLAGLGLLGFVAGRRRT